MDPQHLPARPAIADLFTTLFRESAQGIVIADQSKQRFVDVNDAFVRITGWSRDEAVGKTATELGLIVAPSERDALLDRLTAEHSVSGMTTHFRTKSGDTRTLLVSAYRIDAGGGGWMMALLQDITDARAAHEALLDRERRLQMLLDQVPAVLWTVDTDLRFTSSAGGGLAALGAKPNQFVGLSLEEFLTGRDEVFRDRVVEQHRRALRGESVTDEDSYDGRFFESHIEPLRAGDGTIVGCIGVTLDVTERKAAEEALRAAYDRERDATASLRALNETKNAFLTAVSHELRTPLAAVLGFALTLADREHELGPDDRREALDRLAVNARRLDKLLGDLLDLDRMQRGILEPRRGSVDLARIIGHILEEMSPAGRVVELIADEVTISVDTAQIERIVENLVTNAMRYSPAGTKIVVRVVRDDAGAWIIVDDEGPGVPDEFKTSIFEPFVRGPAALSYAPGTGVGLSLVAKFAELHGGRALVEDRPGGGASFRVFLPG